MSQHRIFHLSISITSPGKTHLSSVQFVFLILSQSGQYMTFETFYLRAGNNDWAVAVDIWRFLMPLTSGVF